MLIKIFPLEKIMSNAIKYLFLSSLILMIIYCFWNTSALILQIIRCFTFFCCGLLLGNTTTRVVSAVKGLALLLPY